MEFGAAHPQHLSAFHLEREVNHRVDDDWRFDEFLHREDHAPGHKQYKYPGLLQNRKQDDPAPRNAAMLGFYAVHGIRFCVARKLGNFHQSKQAETPGQQLAVR